MPEQPSENIDEVIRNDKDVAKYLKDVVKTENFGTDDHEKTKKMSRKEQMKE